jgi:hypothetical protein
VRAALVFERYQVVASTLDSIDFSYETMDVGPHIYIVDDVAAPRPDTSPIAPGMPDFALYHEFIVGEQTFHEYQSAGTRTVAEMVEGRNRYGINAVVIHRMIIS